MVQKSCDLICYEIDERMKDILDSFQSERVQIIFDDGSINTAHTTNLVPFIILDKNIKLKEKNNSSLKDIAPTILKIMNLKIPKEMKGDVLIDE